MAFQRAAKRAGLVGFRFHDLRHDFASQFAMRGLSLKAIKELLGHSSLQMTDRYSHLAPDYVAEALRNLPDLPGNAPERPALPEAA